jgi:16S rRNA processing protein RimM
MSVEPHRARPESTSAPEAAPATPPEPARPPTVEVVVGRIGRPHGLRGDVVVDVRTDEPARRFAVGTRLGSPLGPLGVTSTQWHGSRLLVHFAEVGDRDKAETLRGVELRVDVPTDERPEDPEEFYDHQLVGLNAFDSEGQRAGEVTEVLHLPAQDVLVIRRADGSSALVLFVRELVPDVDLRTGRLELSQPTQWLSGGDGNAQPAGGLDQPELW